MPLPDRETAYAKVNLALHVRARLPDGYHRIETLFAFASDGDVLTATPAETLSLSIAGPHARGLEPSGDNLVLKAAHALRAAFSAGKGAAIALEKNLPVASGLGGGSSDAAATLRLLCRLWDLPIADPRIDAIARSLGADVPACLKSETCFGTGRGDDLSAIDLPGLSGTPVLLVNPGVSLETGPVFAGWDQIDRGPLDPRHWSDGRNDLTASAVSIVPAIADTLSRLRAQNGVSFAAMSGSGASCFALFDTVESRDQAAGVFAGHWVMLSRLR
jgi:4-diphosphocytidyl-2-C-methyl-D-erythritol kinase